MFDFSSALYLGLQHPSNSLRPWQALTTGSPAAFTHPPGNDRVAQALANLIGCERGTLATSTLHVFWDLFNVLATERIVIYIDKGAYPIAQWGIERVATKGIRVIAFSKHVPNSLAILLNRNRSLGLRPVIVTDGLYTATGAPSPLVEYMNLVRPHEGYVVMDDTQAFGILGHAPEHLPPYGVGGGGTPAWYGIQGPELIVVSSLAKGFGVPLAVLAGNVRFISKFEDLATTRIHCSPPSAPLIRAAENALMVNEERGDSIRGYLARVIRFFRNRLRQIGLSAFGGLFPVQTLKLTNSINAVHLHELLLRWGVRTVLHKPQDNHEAQLSFLITAMHTMPDIDNSVKILQQAFAVMQEK